MSYALKNRLLVLLMLISSPLFGMTAKLGLGQKLRSRLATTSSNLSNKIKPKTSNTVSLSKTNKQPEGPIAVTTKSPFYDLIKDDCPLPKEVITSIIFSYLTQEEINRLLTNKIEHIYVILKRSYRLPADLVMTYLSTEEIDSKLPVILLELKYELSFTEYDGPVSSTSLAQTAIDTNGSLVYTVNPDNTVILWDAKSGNKKHVLKHNDKINATTFSKDGTLLAISSNNKVVIWNTETGTVIRTLPHKDSSYLKFNDTGTQIITIDFYTTIIWNIKTGRALHTINCHSVANRLISINKENSHAITAPYSEALIWDLKNIEEPLYTLDHGNYITSLRSNNNNTALITAGGGGNAKLWNIKTGELIHTFKHAGRSVDFAEFSDDDRYIITASDNIAKIWDVESGEIIQTLKHEKTVTFAQFNNDNSCVITSTLDSKPIVWDIKTGKILALLNINSFKDVEAVLNNNNNLALVAGRIIPSFVYILQVPSLSFNQLLLLSRIHIYAHGFNKQFYFEELEQAHRKGIDIYANDIKKQFSLEELAQAYNQDPKEVLETWLSLTKEFRNQVYKLYNLKNI